MTVLRYTLLSISLLPALVCGCAQQSYGRYAPPTPAQRGATAPRATAPAVTPDYIIGADDSLQITVFDNPNLSATIPVRPDGMITLPDIGDIVAAGRTPMQLTADITARESKLVIDPHVTVTVLAFNSKRVYLLGEVMHVGSLNITPGMSVLQAIASAGGLTPYAKKHLYILRGEPGRQKKIPFDYTRAVKNGDMQGVTLAPGDTIVVP